LAKFYVVWRGRKTGIFTDWASCKAQVDAFPGARYKSFKTRLEAESALGQPSVTQSGRRQAPSKISATKKVKPTALTDTSIMAMPEEIKIFTDGACEPNPGEAGSGIAVYQSNQLTQLWYGIYEAVGTNNTAELNALHQSLIMAENCLNNGQSVAIFSDSSYSIQCLTSWAPGWAKSGWVRKGGEIKNLELIKTMYKQYLAIQDRIIICHVNGHVGVEGNELADRMSILAIESKMVGLTAYTGKLDIAEILKKRRG
jgi:ribonuclease HI